MLKIKIILLTLLMASTAQAIMPYSVFNPEARIEVLSKESYQQAMDEIKQEETNYYEKLTNTTDDHQAHLIFCNIVENKFERFALASANIKYEKTHKDIATLSGEEITSSTNIKYERAYEDFRRLRKEIELTLQSKDGMRYPCY